MLVNEVGVHDLKDIVMTNRLLPASGGYLFLELFETVIYKCLSLIHVHVVLCRSGALVKTRT
jgi:hypothetical protein